LLQAKVVLKPFPDAVECFESRRTDLLKPIEEEDTYAYHQAADADAQDLGIPIRWFLNLYHS
jgi:hypothetical protein